MNELINGYMLLSPLSNQDAGFAKWGHAVKNRKDYFIKEFLDPCYPMKDSPFEEAVKQKIIESCTLYEAERTLLYSRINRASDGNVVRICDFFRWNGRYYITTDWIEAAYKVPPGVVPGAGVHAERISIDDLHLLDADEDRVRCCLALSHALMCLHAASIIHSDLKPKNIILTHTESGGISPKIIDVDSSFFLKAPPEELVGDQVYFAPESILHMIRGPEESSVGYGIDVFALGLIFHQVFSGELPTFPGDYNFACEACLDGASLRVSRAIPGYMRDIISGMVEADAAKRPSMADVHRRLWEWLYGRGSWNPHKDEDSDKGAFSAGTAKTNPAPTPHDAGREEHAGVNSRIFINMGSTGGAAAEGGGDVEPGASGSVSPEVGAGEADRVFFRPSGL